MRLQERITKTLEDMNFRLIRALCKVIAEEEQIMEDTIMVKFGDPMQLIYEKNGSKKVIKINTSEVIIGGN